MDETERSILDFQMKYLPQIRRLCQPLKDHFGISIFNYYWIDKEGNHVGLSNDPDYLEYYIGEGLYKKNPFLVHPFLLRSGHVLTPKRSIPRFSAHQRQLYEPFLILDRQGDTCEGFVFIADQHVKSKRNFYFNYLESLKTFTAYFKQEAAEIIEKMKRENLSLSSLKKELFYTRPSLFPISSQDKNVEEFLKAILPLTNRERECHALFKKGYSAQATATLLDISPRTVEHCFESIKDKLGCSSKWDLLRW